MKKRLLTIAIGICAMLMLGACGKKNESQDIQIVTSFYPMYIAAINITDGIEGVSVENLASPDTGCLHDYQLKPSDMTSIEDADIMIANGGGMESFLDDVIKNQNDLTVILATDGMKLIESDHDDHDHSADDHDEDEELDHEHEFNAHAWMDLSLYADQIESIADQLAQADPEHGDQYKENAKIYAGKVRDLAVEMHSELDGISNSNIVILHDAFAYFANEFGLNVIAAIEVESEAGLSAKEIKELVQDVKATGAEAVFAEKQYSGNVAKTITEETGMKSYVWDSCVTGEMDKDAYLNAMRENAVILKEALAND